MKSCFDTDKAFHMSFDEVTFNADRIRSKLELLSEELMPRCGLVYELYQRRLSAAIDNFVATLCVFRSIRSRIGIEVRSAIRIHSINRELNFFYRFLTRFFAAFHYRGIFPQ